MTLPGGVTGRVWGSYAEPDQGCDTDGGGRVSEVEAFPVPGRHRVPDDEPEPVAPEPLPAGPFSPPAAPTLVREVAPDLAAILHAAPPALVLLDLDGTALAGNAAAEELTGRTGAGLAGLALAALVPELAAVEVVALLERARGGHRSATAARLVHADGHDLPVVLAVAPATDGAGRPTHLVLHVDDRSEQTAREARLVHRAFHDPLTGLPHRILFLDRLHEAVLAGHEHGTSTCVLVLDVSGLAELDAAQGHAAGDRAVVELAGRLRAAVRSADTAACLGPETFAVLCEDTAAEHGAVVAERLCALTSGPVEALAGSVHLVTSVRVSSVGWCADPAAAFATLLSATGAPAGPRRGRASPLPRRVPRRR